MWAAIDTAKAAVEAMVTAASKGSSGVRIVSTGA